MKPALSLVLLTVGCGGAAAPLTESALHLSAPNGSPQQGDQPDQSCNVVLRTAYVNLESALGPQTDCSSGTCWAVVNVTVDVATSEDQASAQPYVLYQGSSGTWSQAPGAGIWGAQLGYRRYQFTLNSNTFTAGESVQAVQLIPFLRTVSGARLFDHNRNPNPVANYQLTNLNDWQIQDDGTTCQGGAPHGIQTLVFAQGWQNSGYGSLVQSGKLDINYDIYRIPSGLGCSQDGEPTFAVTGYVQFQPGGTILTELINGPFNTTTDLYPSVPLEFDVPANATSAALWFLDSSECNGDQWDSQYGQNYVYPVFTESQPSE